MSPQVVKESYCPSDVRLLDRRGVVLHEVRIDPTRRRLAWMPLEAVSPALTAAVLESEDRRFFAHGGVDWRAVAAAVWERVRGGPTRGASTISMQLAALLDSDLRPRHPRGLGEKWRQMQAAWALERDWSKQQILEAYLNLVTFRGELQGIGAAAQILFDKAPHGLTQAESAVLAALIRAPNADRDTLGARAARPRSQEGDLAAALDRVFAAPRSAHPAVALAPHAARRLIPVGEARCSDTTSTIDVAVQRVAAASVRRHLLAIADRSVRDAAVLVADNVTGEVLAYVAGSGTLSSAPHVDGIQARRQAGSTLKPFLYARALERRLLTPASLLDDSPLEIAVGPGLFRPRNYDQHFRGLVSVAEALAGSLNIPAVRTLLLVGADDFADQLRELGFAGVTQHGDYYGPALALGAADVTLSELVNAYRTLANGGRRSPLRLAPAGASAIPDHEPSVGADARAAAFVVSEILADREHRSVTFGLESALATPFWTAVKTGTSTDMRDNWCVGYSRRYTVGVWVGNFSGEPMRDVSGVTGAAPIWAEVMTWLHRDLASDPPDPPPSIRRAGHSFLAGTEPAGASLLAKAPEIVAPTDGSVIAIDPDIAPARQRVLFEARGGGPDARWILDDADIGAASEPLLWQPIGGAHTLQLVDATRPLATVRFQVRGPTNSPQRVTEAHRGEALPSVSSVVN